jgi:hypothetical protein
MGQKLGSAWVSCPVVNDRGAGAFVSQGSLKRGVQCSTTGCTTVAAEYSSQVWTGLRWYLNQPSFWRFASWIVALTISYNSRFGRMDFFKSKHSLGGSNPGPSQDQDRLECGPMSLKHIQTHGPNFQHFPTVHSMSVYVPHNPQLIWTWHCQLDTVNLTPSLLRS